MSTSPLPLRLGMITVEPHGRPWAEVLVRWPDVKMVSAWDYDPEQARGYAERYQIPQVVEHVGEMLGQVDAVLIGGGRRMPGKNSVWGENADDHLALARPFLEAGLPVLVDKPMADRVEDAVTMIQLARRHGALLMTCSALRYDASVMAAKDQIDDGGLGRVAGAVCMIGTGRATLKWYIVHILEAVHTAFGPGIESVFAQSSSAPLLQGDLSLADAYGLMFRWRDGRLATMLMACDETDAAGGNVLAERTPHVLWPTATILPPYLPFHYNIRIYGDMDWVEIRPVGKGYYGRKLRAFLNMIATGREAIPLEHSLEITEGLVAAERSLVSGRVEALRPVEELLSQVGRTGERRAIL